MALYLSYKNWRTKRIQTLQTENPNQTLRCKYDKTLDEYCCLLGYYTVSSRQYLLGGE